MTSTSLILPPDIPPERLIEFARAAEEAEIDTVWLWEDCFATSGVGLAAAILAATTRLRVGIGLLPVPLRNVALTAMEIASLARMYPGRFRPAIGHGVLSWMAQTGSRVASPLTLLREYGTALRRLLAGESVTVAGRYVSLEDVRLRWPPNEVPPLLLGAEGPKTLALAGEISDGIVVSGLTDDGALATAVRTATAERAAPLEVVAFSAVSVDASAAEIADAVAARAAAGATEVPVLGLAPDGGSVDGGANLRRLITALGRGSLRSDA
ncbi:LLM class flavin-dependent oxidoreductase [Microbacterium gorillae]|uniref:LLM class flavin-dependent oxidoreductase n=1 Tax=Microbacterium gorillae TaxID=1231063 RepID=UPI000B30D513|nr:LLM class flavin-dependent oxidoreductase [Microbacterium gorillae]